MSTEATINAARKPLMGIGMIIVMLFHLWCFYPNYMRMPLTDWTIGFGHLGNELFFFLGGMGCYYSYAKNDAKTYFKHRLHRLLLPCVIAGCIKTFLLMPESNPLIHLVSFDLWFIVAYLVLACLMPVFSRILLLLKGRVSAFLLFLLLYVFSVIVIQLTIPEIPNGILHIAKRGFIPFIAGAWLASSYTYGRDYLKKVPVGAHFAWGMLMLVLFLMNLDWVSDHSMVNDIQGVHNCFIWLALGCPSMVYAVCWLFANTSLRFSFLERGGAFIGAITLELYLFHEFIFNLLMKSPGVDYCFPLAACSMIIFSFLIAWSFHCWINAILAKWKSPNFVNKNGVTDESHAE